MLKRIQKLSLHVANQIAAGEVVERPSAVVKELIENSLDAKASQISIEIEKGGTRLIRIRDNGVGIHVDDLPLAVDRHATSKIVKAEDLTSVVTLGFRGEALASISAVSRFTLFSNATDEAQGWQVSGQGEEMQLTLQPVAHLRGSTVEVRDLFFNVPARKKFLKTERTESKHIEQLVQRLALSHFSVGFKLSIDGKEIYHFKPADDQLSMQKRVQKILGEHFAADAYFLDIHGVGIRLWGWVGKPTLSRAQADGQYFYVNGRMVRDKIIGHAVKRAFHDVMYQDRHPLFVLYLEMNPLELDVNVHPTKSEVRFADSQHVHQFISYSLKKVIAEARPQHLQLKEFQGEQLASSQGEQLGLFQEKSAAGSLALSQFSEPVSPFRDSRSQFSDSVSFREPVSQAVSSAFAPVFERPWLNNLSAEKTAHVGHLSLEMPPLGFALGQVKGTYIVAENKTGLVLVDMHAAHERITYEKLKKQLKTTTITSQTLLLPLVVSVSEQAADTFEMHSAIFIQLGFDMVRFGSERLKIHALPALLSANEVGQLIADMLEDLLQLDVTDPHWVEDKLNGLLAEMACHSALRSKDLLSIEEMNRLLREMEATEQSNQCNHGRPTWVQWNQKELDKFFLRGR